MRYVGNQLCLNDSYPLKQCQYFCEEIQQILVDRHEDLHALGVLTRGYRSGAPPRRSIRVAARQLGRAPIEPDHAVTVTLGSPTRCWASQKQSPVGSPAGNTPTGGAGKACRHLRGFQERVGLSKRNRAAGAICAYRSGSETRVAKTTIYPEKHLRDNQQCM